MRTRGILRFGLCMLLAVFIAGCTDTPNSIINDLTSAMTRLNKALERVKDEASANAATKEVHAVAKQLEAIAERAKKMPKPTADQEKAASQLARQKLEPVIKRNREVMARLDRERKVTPELADALVEMGGALFGTSVRASDRNFSSPGGLDRARPPASASGGASRSSDDAAAAVANTRAFGGRVP